MAIRGGKLGTGHSPRGMWPVLLVLLAAVLVPTACVLWFMNVAMQNDQLAMRQRLGDVYRQHLAGRREALEAFWTAKLGGLKIAPDVTLPQALGKLVAAGGAPGMILHKDGASFPFMPPASEGDDPMGELPDWAAAKELEFEAGDYARAAAAYLDVARGHPEANLQARSLQARARCLALSGEKQKALDVLAGSLSQEKYQEARDNNWRLLAPDAALYAIELMRELKPDEWQKAAEDLAATLRDQGGDIPASQRVFLMRSLRQLSDKIEVPTLKAEEIALDYLQERPSGAKLGVLSKVGKELWHVAGPNGEVTAIFPQEALVTQLGAVASASPVAQTEVTLAYPGQTVREPFMSVSAGKGLPGWTLNLYLVGQDPSLGSGAGNQNARYLWMGGLSIAAIASLAIAMGMFLRRQMRLSRLKNEPRNI